MEIFVFAVLIGLIPAAIAKGKGRSFGLWWLYGAGLFIFALPHSLLMKADLRSIEQQQLSEGFKKCPSCAEMVKREAIKCRYCRVDFSPLYEQNDASKNLEPVEVVKELARNGKKISAIKAYREQTGCSLRDAKTAVENIIES